ncbi:uncharacterized protein FIBRA_02875 [Fibroporia radiculosa]|uniref:Sm domain-containing protein n=1 Tax=Fibroporia radiculosa TaxID=599839 RepID=J4G356_9APHY|nr:uncharacterized protein FIBRA_02875 [Fibroporia radiculosa]CCM00833.1 predicted protein [Fibroporia radiculosa]
MSSLSDHVDRISLLAKSIQSNSLAATPISSGPFTHAVLQTPLGDLIRDIDPAELGLFTLVPSARPPVDAEVGGPQVGEIARAEFHGATPLRRPPPHKVGRPDAQRMGEYEPEVYARAAVKYLDRYQSIRPMPRASEQASSIVEQLETVRENIQKLNDKLKQHTSTGPAAPPASPSSIIKEEERRIQTAGLRITELKKQRDSLLKRKASASSSKPKPNLKSKSSTPTPPPLDDQEEAFWNTPGAAARTLHFTGDSLLDEEVDMGNISAVSFSSPVPLRKDRSASRPSLHFEDMALGAPDDHFEGCSDSPVVALGADDTGEDVSGSSDVGESTVVLTKVPTAVSGIMTHDEHQSPDRVHEELPLPSPTKPPDEKPPSDTRKESKIRVTAELERIVSKMWVTVGELIMPGHPFDVSGGGGSKPPRAKETIAHLQLLSTHTPSPTSPSASSLSSFSLTQPSSSSSAGAAQPTAQQILTAHMLLALLSSPPTYAMPLGRLKDVLSAKNAETGVARALGGSAVTRPIYGCVAKRLLKIERGGGQQLIFSVFKTLTDQQVTVELKNDLSITGVLKSVDQFLNIRLDSITVLDEARHPHMMAVKNCFIRGSVVRYVQLPAEHVDTQLLEDATRREAVSQAKR